ncbi:MAG: amidase family protein, partial [Frankia sp.]
MIDPSVWREHGTPLLPATARGPLDGISVAVKDLFAVGGFPVGAGNPRWLEQAAVEAADAWAVRALRAAGASIAGISHTDELAFSLSGTNAHYGTPPNPAAPDLVPGGSTSGPASAVASGQADVGLGTDTAGSIRVPASVCGLYGLRPTHGAVPLDGVVGLAPSFDTVGWLTRDALALRAVGAVLLPPAPVRFPTRLRISDRATASTRQLAGTVAQALGADLVVGPVAEVDDVTDLLAAFRAVQAAEALDTHGPWIRANPGALGADVEARFRSGADVDPATRRRARDLIARSRARMIEVLGPDTWFAWPATAG